MSQLPLIHQIAQGRDDLAVDEKGRIMMPIDKRTVLGPNFRMFHDPRGCLMLMADQMWLGFIHKVIGSDFNPLDSIAPDVQVLSECVLTNSEPVRVDPQGRMVIPQRLRALIGNPSAVVLKGKGHVVELWSASGLEEFDAKPDEERETAAVKKYTSALARFFAPPGGGQRALAQAEGAGGGQ